MDLGHGFYRQEDLTAAREVLYRDPPEDLPGRLTRHKAKRDIVAALYDVLQLYGTHAPTRRYTCRDLNNIPPMSLKNVDPIMMLHQNSEVKAEIESIKNSYQQQMDILLEAVQELTKEVRALKEAGPAPPNAAEQRADAAGAEAPPPPRAPLFSEVARTPAPAEEANGTRSRRTTAPRPPAEHQPAGGGVPAPGSKPPGDLPPRQDAPAGTRTSGAAHHPPSPRRGRWEEDAEGWRTRVQPTRTQVGTNQRRRLRVVQEVRVPRVEVFVSRLAPETTEEDIAEVVVDIIGNRPLRIQKLRTRHTTYASFRVSAEETHRRALLDPSQWDSGTLVRPYIFRDSTVSGNVANHVQ